MKRAFLLTLITLHYSPLTLFAAPNHEQPKIDSLAADSHDVLPRFLGSC